MAEEKEENKKTVMKSLFSDKEFDWDLSKVAGFGIIICGIVGFFIGKDNFLAVLGFGAALLGWKASVEGV